MQKHQPFKSALFFLKTEKWLSGLRHWFAKSTCNLFCTMGSNPFFSMDLLEKREIESVNFDNTFLWKIWCFLTFLLPFFFKKRSLLQREKYNLLKIQCFLTFISFLWRKFSKKRLQKEEAFSKKGLKERLTFKKKCLRFKKVLLPQESEQILDVKISLFLRASERGCSSTGRTYALHA